MLTVSHPLPPFEENASPAPGRFVKITAPKFHSTHIHHGLYLPRDWSPRQKFPLIVEFPGNHSPPFCTGKIEHCKLGYHASAGTGFIWLVLPFINLQTQSNQLTWWGDIQATVDYTTDAVNDTLQNFNADPANVLLTGFSRGAIATSYIGLHNDAIARLWSAFFPFAHFDGGQYTPAGASQRLARIQNRPVLILYGENDPSGKAGSLAGAKILADLNFPPTLLEIPNVAHTDAWIESDSPQRRELRTWIARSLNPSKPPSENSSGHVAPANDPHC